MRLGRDLFGPAGLLAPYLARPILQRSGLGLSLNGCLVLAVVDKFGPINRTALKELLGDFMDTRTIFRALTRSTSVDLVLADEEEFYAPRNLRDRVRDIEFRAGGAARVAEIDRAIGLDQYSYQVQIQGGPTLTRTKSLLRKEPCFYCREPAAPEGGAVEHFPPKKWGGSDRLSLLLPICRTCNSAHGAILKLSESLAAPVEIPKRFDFPGPVEEAREFVLKMMMVSAAAYAAELNNRNVESARDYARAIFGVWIAVREGCPIVDSTSGVLTKDQVPLDVVLLLERARDLGGLPRLMSKR